MSGSVKTAIVIGAGVVGTATAYSLAKRGIQVTLIDDRAEAGQGTSYANGGQLSYLYTSALASHRIIKELPELALGLNPAFRIKTIPDPEFIGWILAFLRNCTKSRYSANSKAALEVALESRLAMLELLSTHELDFDYEESGKIQLLYSEASIKAAKENYTLNGLENQNLQMLSIEEAEKIEPAIAAATDKPLAALYAPTEAVGDARRFSVSLSGVMSSKLGVTIRHETRVTDVELKDNSASVSLSTGETLETDLVALCTGPDRTLLKKLKLNVPICPMKGYSITAPRGPSAPDISLTDSKRRLVFTPLGDQIRIAGMADLGWKHADIDEKRIATLLKEAQDSLPEAVDYSKTHNHWAGLRPMSPDQVPRIARPHPALAYNLGHGMLGWTMCMGTAERLAKLVEG